MRQLFRKKYWGLSALAALIVLPLLLAAGLQTAQQWLRHSREERFATKKLTTVAVDATAVTWEEEGRELRIGERFFDVVSIHKQGNTLLLHGHYDDAETAVWQLLEQAWKYNQALGCRLLLLLQCLVPLTFLLFQFYCRPMQPCWQLGRRLILPAPPFSPPFCPPRGAAYLLC